MSGVSTSADAGDEKRCDASCENATSSSTKSTITPMILPCSIHALASCGDPHAETTSATSLAVTHV